MVETPSETPKGPADNVVDLEVYRLRREARRIREHGLSHHRAAFPGLTLHSPPKGSDAFD
jgi:hypothetical protein